MDVGKAISEGEKAKDLLENYLFKEIFTSLKNAYLDGWVATDAADVDGRERLYIAVQILDHIQTHVRVVAESGKLAIAQVERIKKSRGIQ